MARLNFIRNFFFRVHPDVVRRSATRFGFSWYMGVITTWLLAVAFVTGAVLLFYYRPTIEHAYTDVVDLRAGVTPGWVRDVHRWAAHAVVIATVLHMLRVFLTGSYKPPRRGNWTIGVVLLVLTLLMSFTGYLLPWDQHGYWAVHFAAGAGKTPPAAGEHTLFRFYVLHCFAIPLIVGFLVVVHLRRVRKDGMSGPQ